MTTIGVEDALVRVACARAGLHGVSLSVLHRHATPVYLLEPAGIVARVSRGEHERARAATAVRIARWLVGHDFPATAAAEVKQPIEVEDLSVTFWTFYPQHSRPAPHAAELGRMLRQLHRLPPPPLALPTYPPLQRLGDALASTTALPQTDRRWLLRRRAELVSGYEQFESVLGEGLIHGDAYPGNTLWDGDRAILGDWDEVAIGPRELDLVNTHHGARFGATLTEREAFTAAYGWDVTTWNDFPTAREIRDLHTLAVYIERTEAGDAAAATELAHRISTLRHGELSAAWRTAT